MDFVWQSDSSADALRDIRDFAMSLDHWVVNMDLKSQNTFKRIAISESGYEINPTSGSQIFECPNCEAETFEIMEGTFEGNPAIGLLCEQCETYGAVFPCGL